MHPSEAERTGTTSTPLITATINRSGTRLVERHDQQALGAALLDDLGMRYFDAPLRPRRGS
jgi:hypothetical protein